MGLSRSSVITGTILAGTLLYLSWPNGNSRDPVSVPTPEVSSQERVSRPDVIPSTSGIPNPSSGDGDPTPETSKLSLEQRLLFDFVNSKPGSKDYDSNVNSLIDEFMADNGYRPFEALQLSKLVGGPSKAFESDEIRGIRADSNYQHRDSVSEDYGPRTGFFPNLISSSKSINQVDHIARISFLNELGDSYKSFNDREKLAYANAVNEVLENPNSLNQRSPSHRSYAIQAHVDLYLDNSEVLTSDVSKPLGNFLDGLIDHYITTANHALDNNPSYFSQEDSLARTVNPLEAYVEIADDISLDPIKLSEARGVLERINKLNGVGEKVNPRY